MHCFVDGDLISSIEDVINYRWNEMTLQEYEWQNSSQFKNSRKDSVRMFMKDERRLTLLTPPDVDVNNIQ